MDEAGKLSMKMYLYDEFWFPRGSAGGLLAKKHPEGTRHKGPTVSRRNISVTAK